MDGVLLGGMQWESEVSRCDVTAVRVALWRHVGLHPQLSCEKSLAEAGDVSFSTGGSHYALSGAARDVVINLGPWKMKVEHNITSEPSCERGKLPGRKCVLSLT